jgi:hypothetical protein
LTLGKSMNGPRNVLLAYVEGSDIDGIEDALERRFTDFVANRTWSAEEVVVVNRRDSAVVPGPGELARGTWG